MLVTLTCVYMGVWACADLAARRYPGRSGFWGFYALALALSWGLAQGLGLVAARFSPQASDLLALVRVPGLGLAAFEYPLLHLRAARPD